MKNSWIVHKYEEPWPYIVIDNFYDDDMWSYLQENLINDYKTYFYKKYKHEFSNGKDGLLYGSKKRHLDRHNRLSFEPHNDPVITNYFLKHTNEEWMKSNFKSWRSYTKLGTYVACKYNYLQFGNCGIHHETEDKVLSISTYLSPEHETGTIIYDKDKNFHSVITWKPNRALIFPGLDNITWHDFMKTEPDSTRITLDFFLTRPDSERCLPVCSVEDYNN
jgi:hypothetical protein